MTARTTDIATTELPVNTLFYGDNLHILRDEAMADAGYGIALETAREKGLNLPGTL